MERSMPAEDSIHDAVKTALTKDGWTITHDPYKLRLGEIRTYIDLAGERPIAAEKAGHKIAVEIKSFRNPSMVESLERALGQYGLYSVLLSQVEPDRRLYLAIGVEEYRQIIHNILTEHATYGMPEEHIETLIVSDDEHGHYMLIEVGWQRPRRIYSVVFHLRLKEGKIWIEQDWTKDGVTYELLDAGVAPDDIVLSFQPPEMRPHSDLARIQRWIQYATARHSNG